MFGHAALPSRIYSYKAKPPVEGRDAAFGQLRAAHVYKNKLVELELARRAAVDAALHAYAPDLPGLKAACDDAERELQEALTAVKAEHQAARERTRGTPAARARVAAARAGLRAARSAHRARRKALFAEPGVVGALAGVEANDLAARKEARAGCGLYFGTYLHVETAARSFRQGPPPKFRRWTGEGSLAVQIQKGMGWDAVTLGQDTRLRVEVLPPSAAADPASRRTATKKRAVLSFRVGSAGRGGGPVWCKAVFHLHRQPPPGVSVKWAYLRRDLVGQREVWSVQFVLSAEQWDRARPDGGRAGVDVNWRATREGLRVAYAVGDDGGVTTLTVPRSVVGKKIKAESLRSIRDRNFNAARDELAGWLAGRAVPEWLAERAAHLRQWRSPGRLAGLARLWRRERFPGDDDAFAALEAWRKQDRHLHDWEAAQAQNARRARDELYRRFARALADRYRSVCVEDTDWRALKALPDADEPADDLARVYGHFAAPGLLTRFIKEAAAEPVERPAALTTKRCHACGSVEDFDAARHLSHTCSACGATWDQDHNAALNLLAAAGGAFPAAAPAAEPAA